VVVGRGVAVVGATLGRGVVGTTVAVGLGTGLREGLGVSVGVAVRIWIVMLGKAERDAVGLGDGEADVPAKRENPPFSITPISSSMSRPPATAARMRSIQRGPRRGGGMIFVVSDMAGRYAPGVPSSLARLRLARPFAG